MNLLSIKIHYNRFSQLASQLNDRVPRICFAKLNATESARTCNDKKKIKLNIEVIRGTESRSL